MTQQPLEFVAAQAEAEILSRISELRNRNDLSPCDKAVMMALYLGGAFGGAKAISIAAIQSRWRTDGATVYTDRSIKDSVKNLLEKYDLPIGSCRIAPHNGYAFIISDEDAEAAVRPLQAEIYSMFRRIKVLAPRSAFVRKLNGQIDMLLEAEQ